ncbi:MAG: YggS family pyridoxal phosphate-dependent enzyme [Clostridiales Family XIII bacterium]|jgi:pyridoxal phosphate enzyme (YggS family)|nr:YggS family pyridoxal phosphate-dependent enzyme [Clostridiales Family XIII bacterium]
MLNIEKNILELKNKIKFLSDKSHFNEDVMLLGATKTRSIDQINAAIMAGLHDIAENRVQEFVDKFDFVKGGRWHFIGHLQKNKVKYMVGKVWLIHSVDSYTLAEIINKRTVESQNILIQINKGGEENKNGINLNEAKSLIKKIDENLSKIKILGLMVVMPIENDEKILRKHFQEVRAVFDKLKMVNFKNAKMKYLSMGMSSDFEEAILEGSNIVRIGTAIFGEREYKNT